jgi:hypothetical protein
LAELGEASDALGQRLHALKVVEVGWGVQKSAVAAGGTLLDFRQSRA